MILRAESAADLAAADRESHPEFKVCVAAVLMTFPGVKADYAVTQAVRGCSTPCLGNRCKSVFNRWLVFAQRESVLIGVNRWLSVCLLSVAALSASAADTPAGFVEIPGGPFTMGAGTAGPLPASD